MEFKSMKELKAYIDSKAKEAMNKGTHVKSEVIETGKAHVQSDVYDLYSPKQYDRTGQLKEQWDTEETANGMNVFPSRRDEDTGKYVPEVIETGQGYDYEFDYNGRARPFIENTRNELAANKGRLTDALKQDLKSIGVNVK
ncbi:hypothetical protein FZC83_02400 [Rossellomorea marisflavi]|uniref:HK97 gp10 family phage protein n=2 Tax=Rossellomorea marisflavi TaxID=189381 RepID=A0A5D4RYH5_9BACI|nr:hypothetical protein FZC83_02400 [Rossellomorea marisflavi]